MMAPLTREDEQFLMALSPAYLEWERITEQRGEQRGKLQALEALLRVRFGELDEALAAIAPQILALPPEEYTALILHSSREELLERFPMAMNVAQEPS